MLAKFHYGYMEVFKAPGLLYTLDKDYVHFKLNKEEERWHKEDNKT